MSSAGAPAVTIATHMLTFLSVLGLRPRLKNATASQFARVMKRLHDFEWEEFGCHAKPPSY